MKLQPSTYFREPCVATREGRREASVAVRVARDMEHRYARLTGKDIAGESPVI